MTKGIHPINPVTGANRVPFSCNSKVDIDIVENENYSGLTKREEFAKCFTAASLSNPNRSDISIADHCDCGVIAADALIERLNKL